MLFDFILFTISLVIKFLFGFRAIALICLASFIASSILYNESTRIAIGISLLILLIFFNSSHLKLEIINFDAEKLYVFK